MFRAIRGEDWANVRALWKVGGSVPIHLHYVETLPLEDMLLLLVFNCLLVAHWAGECRARFLCQEKGSPMDSKKYLMQESLKASRLRSLYCENGFVVWARKFVEYLKMFSTKRSSRKDMDRLVDCSPDIAYNGQVLNTTMILAATSVSECFIDDAAEALQRLSRKFGSEFLACQYSKLAALASAAKRWATETLTAVEVLSFVLLLMADDLEAGAPSGLKGTKSVGRSSLTVRPCATCEVTWLQGYALLVIMLFFGGPGSTCKANGMACHSCGSSWLRLALEKCRMWHSLVRTLHQDPAFEDCGLFQQLAGLGCCKSHHVEGEARMKLQAWFDVSEGKKDKELREGRAAEVKQNVLASLQASLGSESLRSRRSSASLSSTAAQQKVAILAKAKEFRDQHIRFECYGSTASISDCLEKVEASWRSPGELNKAHRVFVLSTALLFDNSPQPWVAGGTWTKSYMAEYKALLQFMKEEASADGDASLHFSGAFSGTSIEAGFVFGQRDRNSSSVRGAFRACRPGA
ncbi:unnamed protein product [Symbiodinium natans]|uniref:Uncharacterized protein n=1 Tax=Symbiodinium natans TaxID=878477 RepID=A0A812QHF2_9DINO|nr:unnamed protein product [Symbiodinium natans]